LSDLQDERVQAALASSTNGDSSAFAVIVAEYQGMVFSIAYHFLHDRALAEDMAQEVFFELYRNLAAIQSSAHLTHWLRRVCAHRCIDLGRRRKSRKETLMDELPEPLAPASHRDPLLSESLQKSVAALPETQRMVVVLRYQEGMAPDEIAELLKMPVNTVKSTLHRSLAELRRKLIRKIGEVKYAFL
jgi:RNA polymerase sigma-70 factor (ECF subfamily)